MQSHMFSKGIKHMCSIIHDCQRGGLEGKLCLHCQANDTAIEQRDTHSERLTGSESPVVITERMQTQDGIRLDGIVRAMAQAQFRIKCDQKDDTDRVQHHTCSSGRWPRHSIVSWITDKITRIQFRIEAMRQTQRSMIHDHQ